MSIEEILNSTKEDDVIKDEAHSVEFSRCVSESAKCGGDAVAPPSIKKQLHEKHSCDISHARTTS